MEIFVEDIPDHGLEIEATEADAWLLALMRDTVREIFTASDKVRLHVSMARVEGNVTLDGELEFDEHPTCDRCLAGYNEKCHVPLHMVLAPLYEDARQEEREEGMKIELVREDLEFGYYEGDRFDLEELIREQILLSQPMKRLCKEECLGLCQYCGKDLNQGSCDCREKRVDPRWEVLRKVKNSR